jgi:hypothetical protein
MAQKTLKEKFDQEKKKFGNIKDAYCKAGLTFEIYHQGNITKIIFDDGKEKKYGSLKLKPGMFISKITNRIVKQRLESGLYVPKNTNPDRYNSNTIMYNSEGIRSNLYKPCVSVDIIGCYWQTAFNLGVIDQITYNKGIEKDREYKDARNIAIGSLGALIMHERYENGKLISHELSRKFGACARLDIVDHVWDMAQRIAKTLGPDFLMFLTDCFFVPVNREKDVAAYLNAEGYRSKAERCEFGSIERMSSGINRHNEEYFTEKVIWYAADKGVLKFHDFSHTHNRKF